MDQDDLLPAAPALLGDEARDIVAAAVEYAGGQLRGVKPTQVQYRPGTSLTVVYEARVLWPGRARVATESVVAMTSANGLPTGVLPIEADGLTIGVWRMAADPMLPGLAVAMSGDGARRLLGGPAGPVSVSVRSYRPTRRAVVALGAAETRFAKVVPPAKTATLHEAHARFAGAPALPAPRVLGVDEDLGIVTLAGLPGTSMVDAIASGRSLPSAPALLDVLERIWAVPATAAKVKSARRDARSHGAVVARTLPEAEARVTSLLEAIGDDPPDAPVATVHGDFYEAQLFVDDGKVTGVLDLDRSGPGAPADDLATMLAHLAALGIHRPPLAETTAAYSAALWPDFCAAAGDAHDLRARVAAVLVGLATGPFRMCRPAWQQETEGYLDHAEAWASGGASAKATITGGIS